MSHQIQLMLNKVLKTQHQEIKQILIEEDIIMDK